MVLRILGTPVKCGFRGSVSGAAVIRLKGRRRTLEGVIGLKIVTELVN